MIGEIIAGFGLFDANRNRFQPFYAFASLFWAGPRACRRPINPRVTWEQAVRCFIMVGGAELLAGQAAPSRTERRTPLQRDREIALA